MVRAWPAGGREEVVPLPHMGSPSAVEMGNCFPPPTHIGGPSIGWTMQGIGWGKGGNPPGSNSRADWSSRDLRQAYKENQIKLLGSTREIITIVILKLA